MTNKKLPLKPIDPNTITGITIINRTTTETILPGDSNIITNKVDTRATNKVGTPE
jgi:hypothetical protein